MRAVFRWGAEVIETHFDLSDGGGAEARHSLDEESAKYAIEECKGFESEMDGDGSDCPSIEEQAERKWRASPEDDMRPEKWT